MELELSRCDVIQTGTSSRGTLAVLPSKSNKQQKIAVGDHSGVVHCFSIKRGEVATAFKTLPSRQRITTVVLGKGKHQKDKIFAVEGNAVKGFNKKGREFFTMNTNLTETIFGLAIHETNMWISGEYVHNHFYEAREKHFYLSPDRINASDIVPIFSGQDFSPVLACQDRVIRVLNGADVHYEASVDGAPTCVKYVLESHDPLQMYPSGQEILYGTENGKLGQLILDSETITRGFQLPNERKLGGITGIYSGIDFTKDGVNDIAVARDDGHLEIYGLDEAGQLQQVFKTRISESIHSVDGGYITSPNTQDLVVHTFSGKVIAFCQPGAGLFQPTPQAAKSSKEQPAEDADLKRDYEVRIRSLKEELAVLNEQVEEHRFRESQTKTQDSPIPAVDISCRCRLDAEDSCYVLTVEAGASIFATGLQCDIPLELMDMDSNVAILSQTPPDDENGSKLLATYRCQDATNRLDIKFKVKEGKGGHLQVMVLPNVTPKISQTCVQRIKPLCLHQRLSQEPSDMAARPLCEVTLSGTFALAEVHNWLGSCLPDVPARLMDDAVTLFYENSLTGTVLLCRYRSKEAKFESESVTTLAILREALTREATAQNHRVSLSFTPNPQSVEYNLRLMWPKLDYYRTFEEKVHMIDALQELQLQDEDVSYLSPELASTLETAADIREQSKRQPQHLENMIESLRNLAVDWSRLNGMNAPKQRVADIERLARQSATELPDILSLIVGKC